MDFVIDNSRNQKEKIFFYFNIELRMYENKLGQNNFYAHLVFQVH